MDFFVRLQQKLRRSLGPLSHPTELLAF